MATAMDAEELYQRGFQLRCDGQYGQARLFLESVLLQAPQHTKARHQLALIMGFEGDFDGSLASLTTLSTENPNDLEIRYDLAMTQMMLGDYEAGCANLQFILDRDPTHDRANQQVIYCP